MPIEFLCGIKVTKTRMTKSHGKSQSIAPPTPPWSSLPVVEGSGATLCYYYSDSRSKVPVREVSHKNDPKGDPNLETKTYGLFSVCDEKMRSAIVKKGIPLVFFCTKRAGGIRVLTGYYRINYYYELPDHGDFMLAAEEARFVNPGFSLADLRPYLRGYKIDEWFRTFKYIDEAIADLLLQLLKAAPDATPIYIKEIRRLERLSKKRDGYLYRNKYPKGFNWNVAKRPMKLAQQT